MNTLAPPNTNALVLRAHPFTAETGMLPVRGGRTLQQMLDEAAGPSGLRATLRVEIGGIEVPSALWARVRPKQGAVIHVTGMPAGGGGGNNKLLRTVLLIVVMVVAWYASPYLAAAYGGAASTWASAIYMVGSLLVNALVPPPKPPGAGKGTDGQWNALTGSSNQLSPYGPIPCVVGEMRLFPPHAAMPYLETMGTDSYQRLMFDIGYGEVEVSDIQIGNTPLTSFEGVQYEVTKTPTLYTSDVQEEPLSIVLEDGDVDQRTTAPDVDEISLDIVFPAGLFSQSNDGDFLNANVFFSFEYRLTGTTTWTLVSNAGSRRSAMGYISNPDYTSQLQFQQHPFFCRRDDRKPFAASIGWKVDRGQYDVRVTRYLSQYGNADNDNAHVGKQCTWGVLRSIRATNPSTTGTTKLCMRIKSSEQLSGTLQSLSCLVKQKVPVWDRDTATWSAPQLTTNPGWVYAWMLRGCPAFAVHVADSRIDFGAIADFADFCDVNSFECRGVLDARVTARDAIDDVLACSLGALTMRDGKYGVLFDDGTTVPTMAFSPLDSRDYRVTRAFTRLPDALRVRFKNATADWRDDEVIVLDDGFSYRGVDARGVASSDPEPETFEILDLRMSADPIHAWRVGRAHFAQAKFRPTQHSWETDIANLACTRGDLVQVASDVSEWGAGWGRVASLVAGGLGGTAATLTLDQDVETVAGRSYSVQLRKQDGSAVVVACTPHSVETSTFYLASLPTGINAGDVAVLGETGRETAKLLITGIVPAADLAARITAVPYDERVAPYWANPPASIVSEVTGTTFTDGPEPPVVTVTVSDPVNDPTDDGGTGTPTVHVVTGTTNGYFVNVALDMVQR